MPLFLPCLSAIALRARPPSYQGKISPYPYTMNWLQLFDDPQLAGELYGNDFPLVDVTVIPDEEIMQHRRMAILELLQKHIRQRDLAELVEQLVTLLLAGYTTKEQLVSVVNYMLQAGEARDSANLLNTLASRVPQHEETLMTIAEQLRREGEQRGIQKGRLEGIQEGRKEEALKIARAMLANGLDHHSVMKMTGLSEDELAEIRH